MEKGKNNKILKIIIIIMLFIIITSSAGIIVYFVLKNDVSSKTEQKTDWKTYSYDLKEVSFPIKQKNYDVGYTKFENDRYKIFIDNEKVYVEDFDDKKTFSIKNINNVKKILVSNNLSYIILTEDGNTYGLYGKAIDYYANPNSEKYEESAFKEFKSDCEISNLENKTNFQCNDKIKFTEIYMLEHYFSGNYNVEENNLFYALGEDNNIYRLSQLIYQKDDEPQEIYFGYEKLETTIDEVNKKLNNNLLFMCSYQKVGLGIDINGKINIFKDDSFLDNKVLYDNNEIRMHKMICKDSTNYFVGENNILYKLNNPSYITYNSTFNLEMVNEGKKIKTISYLYKDKYYDYNSNQIKEIVFKFEDDSEYTLSNVYSSETYGILMED